MVVTVFVVFVVVEPFPSVVVVVVVVVVVAVGLDSCLGAPFAEEYDSDGTAGSSLAGIS